MKAIGRSAENDSSISFYHSSILPSPAPPLLHIHSIRLSTLHSSQSQLEIRIKKDINATNMQEMKVGPSSTREHLLRPQSGQKMKLKEKFVEIYDTFLRVSECCQGNKLAPVGYSRVLETNILFSPFYRVRTQ